MSVILAFGRLQQKDPEFQANLSYTTRLYNGKEGKEGGKEEGRNERKRERGKKDGFL